MEILRFAPTSPVQLLGNVWEQLLSNPSALTATVDALQMCQRTEADQRADRKRVDDAITAHFILLRLHGDTIGRQHTDGSYFLGSDILQRYAMDVIAAVPQQAVARSIEEREPFIYFIAKAADAGVISESRLNDLLLHKGILAPLRDGAEGGTSFNDMRLCAAVLRAAWRHFVDHRRLPKSDEEYHAVVQRVMLAALRQGAVILQLRALAMAPGLRRHAVELARVEGFLQVHIPINHIRTS